jgi:N-acetylmuramoyl-L-alanine amidase
MVGITIVMNKRIISILLLMAVVCQMTVCGNELQAAAETQKVIVIDAGHQTHAMSATEPIGPGSSTKKAKVTGGATGVATHLPEYKLNLRVAKKLRTELENRGYKVIMVRTKNNVTLSNAERAKIANKYKADAFIRIHANSSESSSVKGALTIAPQSDNPYMTKKNRKKSQSLSKKVLKEFCKATGASNRGVMYTNTMTGINWCSVPVTIVEMGFLSNTDEDRKMSTASYQKKMVNGIANGIDKFLK